jgi:hypothetical protein
MSRKHKDTGDRDIHQSKSRFQHRNQLKPGFTIPLQNTTNDAKLNDGDGKG